MKTTKQISRLMPLGLLYKSTLELVAAAVLTGGMATVAHAQNLLLNGDFTANAAAFTTWPGNTALGSNPAAIADWYQIIGGNPVGVNGAGVGFAGSPFGPTSDGGNTYAFIQNGVDGLAQNLPSLNTDTSYQISFEAANRASDLPVTFRVQIGDASQTDFTTQVGGNDVLTGNPAAFTQYSYMFTTTATFNGVPSIQLYNLSSTGTIDFANMSVTAVSVPEPIPAAYVGFGVMLIGAGHWSRRRSGNEIQK